MLRSHPLSRSCSTGLLILPGIGIAVPIFIPAIVTAVVSLLLSRSDAAPPGSARRSPQSAGPAPLMAFFSPASLRFYLPVFIGLVGAWLNPGPDSQIESAVWRT